MKKSIKALSALLAVLVLTVSYLLIGFNNDLKVRRYTVETGSFTETVNIALLTDFHSYIAGESLNGLIETVIAENPDIVLLGGDIFNDGSEQGSTICMMAELASLYPCYYVTGNHEYYDEEETLQKNLKSVEECGVIRLSRENAVLTINGQTFNLCGVDDPSNMLHGIDNDNEYEFYHQIDYLKKETANGNYTILLSHRPEYFNRYKGNFDLVLTGHTHGGQVRFPPFINGLFAPDQGWFPEYGGGKYEYDGTTMIVSRGLTALKKIVPRFYNRPELVIITLK